MWERVKLGSIQFPNEVLKFRYYRGRVKLVYQNHMGELSLLGFTPDLLDENHWRRDLHFMNEVLRALLVKPAHRRFKNRTSIWDVSLMWLSYVAVAALGQSCTYLELVVSVLRVCSSGEDGQDWWSIRHMEVEPTNVFWKSPSENPTPMEDRIRNAFGCMKTKVFLVDLRK